LAGTNETVNEDLVRRERRAAHEMVALGDVRIDHLRKERSCAGDGIVDTGDFRGDRRFLARVKQAGGCAAVVGGHFDLPVVDQALIRVYTPIMNDDPCLCTGLRQAALAATQIYDEVLQPTGLKITMFRLLRRISEAGQPTISELARIVDLDRSTLGRNLKVLERLGHVQLAGGRDDRSKIVSLTARGKIRLEKALPLWTKAQRSMQSWLGDDKAAVYRILSKVNREAANA
jgi:DNA-binding MarR family transcriptional regulator